MRALSLNIALLSLFIGYTVNAIRRSSTCGKAINISCDSYHIVIVDVNTTSSLVSTLLEQCNAHQHCNVRNLYDECIQVSYWCRNNVEPLEIREGSTVQLNSKDSLMSLMSENYRDGQYSDPQHIHCGLKLDEKTMNAHMTMNLRIYEFSSMENCTKLCLNSMNSHKPAYCTTSRKLDIPYGTIDGAGNWQFNLTMAQRGKCIAKSRFWMELDVFPDAAGTWHLFCNSRPVYEPTFTKGLVTTEVPGTGSMEVSVAKIIASVFGAVMLINVVAFTAAWMCRKSNCKWKRSAREKDHEYNYIDVNEMDLRGVESQGGPQSINSKPAAVAGMASLSQSLGTLGESSILQCRLPPLPGEIQVESDDSSSQNAESHDRTECSLPELPGEDSDHDDEYLPPRESTDLKTLQGSEGLNEMSTDKTIPETVDSIEVPNDVDALNKDNEGHESAPTSEKDITENEYVGLIQENLNNSDTSSRSSSGILYTLLQGRPRAEVMEQDLKDTEEDLTDHSLLGNQSVIAEDQSNERDTATSEKQSKVEIKQLSEKDENDYLVLISDEEALKNRRPEPTPEPVVNMPNCKADILTKVDDKPGIDAKNTGSSDKGNLQVENASQIGENSNFTEILPEYDLGHGEKQDIA